MLWILINWFLVRFYMQIQVSNGLALDSAIHAVILILKQGGWAMSNEQEARLRLEIGYQLHAAKSSIKIEIRHQ